jgi:hypothetical protein
MSWSRRHLPLCKRFADLMEEIYDSATFEQCYPRSIAAIFGTTVDDMELD